MQLSSLSDTTVSVTAIMRERYWVQSSTSLSLSQQVCLRIKISMLGNPSGSNNQFRRRASLKELHSAWPSFEAPHASSVLTCGSLGVDLSNIAAPSRPLFDDISIGLQRWPSQTNTKLNLLFTSICRRQKFLLRIPKSLPSVLYNRGKMIRDHTTFSPQRHRPNVTQKGLSRHSSSALPPPSSPCRRHPEVTRWASRRLPRAAAT